MRVRPWLALVVLSIALAPALSAQRSVSVLVTIVGATSADSANLVKAIRTGIESDTVLKFVDPAAARTGAAKSSAAAADGPYVFIGLLSRKAGRDQISLKLVDSRTSNIVGSMSANGVSGSLYGENLSEAVRTMGWKVVK